MTTNQKLPDANKPHQTMSRREMIRTSGLATLGLVYMKPQIEIVRGGLNQSLDATDYGGNSESSEDGGNNGRGGGK